MKQIASNLTRLIGLCALVAFISCSKSSSSNNNNNTTPSVVPLALNNSWYYKIKNYDTATGLITDSSYSTLSIGSNFTANGTTYYQFLIDGVNSLQLSNINNTTVGAIDSAFGVHYYTIFVSGAGDSTKSVSSWPIKVSVNGNTCQGTDYLFAHYADTTLVNEDGIVYSSCLKNIAVSFNCSGTKISSHVYFIKEGVGMARIAHYYYNAAGVFKLYQAWVLESETLN
jgi:hypothetical protein